MTGTSPPGSSEERSDHHTSGTLVRQLPAQCKVAAGLVFVLAVVAAPRQAVWAYACFAVLLAGVAAAARVPCRALRRGLVLELPFVAFAVVLPLVGDAPHTHLGPLRVSVAGAWAAWGIVAKGTLGVAASTVLRATTPILDLLAGLERLRAPRLLTTIAGFMVRYGEVVAGDMRRMATARAARGHDPRSPRQWAVLATAAGALLVRSYERGERVHLAMCSRGYTGDLPATDTAPATGRAWTLSLAVPVTAACVTALAWAVPG